MSFGNRTACGNSSSASGRSRKRPGGRHLQAQFGRYGSSLPHMITLHSSGGDECIGALGQCIGKDVLKFADLVAAEGEAGVEVFSCDPYRWAR